MPTAEEIRKKKVAKRAAEIKQRKAEDRGEDYSKFDQDGPSEMELHGRAGPPHPSPLERNEAYHEKIIRAEKTRKDKIKLMMKKKRAMAKQKREADRVRAIKNMG